MNQHQKQQEHPHDPTCRLAEHLMVLCGRGTIDVNSPEHHLESFFKLAPARTRSRAVEFVGWSFGREDGPSPQEVIDRFMRLWDWRSMTILQGDLDSKDDSELKAFGTWYGSGKFPRQWSIDRMLEALRACGSADTDHWVMERLCEDVKSHPAEAIECAGLMVEGDTKKWRIYSWRNELREVLQVGLAEGDAAVKTAAEGLVHKMGTLGYFDFRDLIDDE